MSDDERVPVTLTEATYDETGVHIRGTIPYDQAVRLGITQGEADARGFSLANRWAAFTDDELNGYLEIELRAANEGFGSDATEEMAGQVKAELERRKP